MVRVGLVIEIVLMPNTCLTHKWWLLDEHLEEKKENRNRIKSNFAVVLSTK